MWTLRYTTWPGYDSGDLPISHLLLGDSAADPCSDPKTAVRISTTILNGTKAWYTCTGAHRRTYTHTHPQIYLLYYIHIHVYVYVCTSVCMYVCMCAHIHGYRRFQLFQLVAESLLPCICHTGSFARHGLQTQVFQIAGIDRVIGTYRQSHAHTCTYIYMHIRPSIHACMHAHTHAHKTEDPGSALLQDFSGAFCVFYAILNLVGFTYRCIYVYI